MIELAVGVGLVLQPGGWGAHQGRRGLLPSPLLSGPSTWFWVSHRPALPPFLYALCVHRLSVSVSISLRSALLCFNHLASLWRVCPPSSPSLSASATLFTSCCSFPPCPVFPYLCLLPTISPLFPLSLCPLTNLPSPLPAATAPLLSCPFSLRIFCSPPFHPHCLSQIPLFPCGAGSSQ